MASKKGDKKVSLNQKDAEIKKLLVADNSD